MKDHKAYVTKRNLEGHPIEYQVYLQKFIQGRRERYDNATQEVGCQYDIRRDNVICTCRNPRLRRPELGYFGSPKQIYAYHETRSFTEIGVGSVKALMRKKVRKIYLPETEDRGVGSSDLSSLIIRKTKPRENSYYDHKRTSSKCVGGIIEYNTGCVLSQKLSPIIQTKSGTTSPIEQFLNKNQEIGSDKVINLFNTTTTQVDTEVNDKCTVHSFTKDKEVSKVNKQRKKKKSKMMNVSNSIDAKSNAAEKVYSSDSLVQRVHNLETPSEEKPSHTSVDPMENKLEREYRRIFSTKSKEEKPRSRTSSDFKSSSILKRRFEALRRGLAKKEDSKRNAVLMMKVSSQFSAPSHKDVSIASDPPSLESRSYSNTKPFSPYTSIDGHEKIYDRRATHQNSVSSRKDRDSLQWPQPEDDSETQGVKGMFRLWGKKFNLDEDNLKSQPTPGPSINISKKSIKETEALKASPKGDTEEKKEGKKFFFFKKKSKDKAKPYKQKKGITTGRCEVRDGLMIKIGVANNNDRCEEVKESISDTVIDDYDEIIRKAWLKKYLTPTIESRNSVKIRWNNKTYATSSSTVFQLMDNVYKEAGVIIKSRSEMTIAESSYYTSFTRQQINYVYQNIETWMIPKTVPDRPKELPVRINFQSSEEANNNIKIRISDQKLFIDKSKTFFHKIEVVLHSKIFSNLDKKKSSEYLRIDIPKGFFMNSSSEDKRNQSSDEQVYKIVEYETESEIKKNKIVQSLSDHKDNDIEVTVNVASKNIEPDVLETVIKTPAMHRDIVIQGSNVYIPKRCDVIGVGIITQRDLKETRKPILKIRDDLSDEESEHVLKSHHRNSKFAERYLQDYYRHWHGLTPLGFDFYSWCVSDSLLRCCSEISIASYNYQIDGIKSCPNLFDDFQSAKVVSSRETSSCNRFVAYVDENKTNENFSSKFFMKKNTNKKEIELDGITRVMPKDSIEVFKKRKLYALSDKSKWASADDEPYSVPSNESRGAQNGSPKMMKSCRKVPEAKAKKRGCKKHVSMSDCDAIKKLLGDHIPDLPGILAFKGLHECDACKQPDSTKTAMIKPGCIAVIPKPPCKESCEKMKKPPCEKSGSPTNNLSPKCSPLPCTPVPKPCNPTCPLSKTLSPTIASSCPSSPTNKPSPIMKLPPAKAPCVPQCPSNESSSAVAKKPCPPAKKPSPPAKIPCSKSPPRCPSPLPLCPPSTPPLCPPFKKSKSPCDTLTPPPGIKLNLTSKASPTGSVPSSPRHTSPGSPPCSKITTPPKKICQSPPKSGESSPCVIPSCPRKSLPMPKPCPLKLCPKKSPPRSPKACCSAHCKGIKPHPKPCEQKTSPCKLPELSQVPLGTGEISCCPLCKRSSGSDPKLPGPLEVSPKNTSKHCNKKTKKNPCTKLFEMLRGTSKCKSDTPPRLPSPCSPPTNLQRSKSCGPCPKCNVTDLDFPWPTKNQISNQSLLPKYPSAPTEDLRKFLDTRPCATQSKQSLIKIQGMRCCDHEQVSRPCDQSPCCDSGSPPYSPNRVKSYTQEPLENKSKAKISGVHLKMKPCTKDTKESSTVKCQVQGEYGCIRLSSKENLTIRMKAQSPSTEEIRDLGEGLNIKVQDEDGQTLYERRDYRAPVSGGQHRPSVLGDMYRNSNVIHSLHRISTQVIGEAQVNKPDNEVKNKSDASLTNIIEIQFQMKITDGEKTTEIAIANDVDKKKKKFKPPEEVFIVNNESERSNDSKDAKNDINIRIVIKNFRSKSEKNKPRCYNEDFSKEISEKFHTVSTGYSNNMCDENGGNAFSVHRATVDLTTSGDKPKISGLQNALLKGATECKSINIIKSVHSGDKSNNFNETIEDKTKIRDTDDKHITNNEFFKTKISANGDLSEQIFHTDTDIPKTDTDFTDNDDTDKCEVFKLSDFAKKNYLTDKYDFTDIDDFTEKDDITERDDLTEKDDMTEKEDFTEKDDMSEREDLTEKEYLTEKEELSEKEYLTNKEHLAKDEALTDNKDPTKNEDFIKIDLNKKDNVTWKKNLNENVNLISKEHLMDKEILYNISDKEYTPEKEYLTKNDYMTEKEDLTDKEDLYENKDVIDKNDIVGKENLTKKEDSDTHKDSRKKEVDFTERSSSHRKVAEVKYVDIKDKRSFQQNFKTPISTDTDDQELILEANTSTDNDTAPSIEVIIHPYTKDEKKEMLKEVFEKANATNVKSRTRMKKLRDMLKSILTSDSSGHEELKVNELAKDLTYESLKPSYFRDSDSMNNYYNCEAISDKESNTRPATYPTEEKNSECSKTSYVVSSEGEETHKECMCNTLAARLNLCKVMAGGCCCCRTVLKDEQIDCDIKSDFHLDLRAETRYMDVETQNSKYCANKNNSNEKTIQNYTKSNIIETCNVVKVEEKAGVSNGKKNEKKPLKSVFSPNINQIKECRMRKLNKDACLTISDDDKIVLLGGKEKVPTEVVEKEKNSNVRKDPLLRASDILQSYEAKKAVLEIYAERTVSEDSERFVAKLPKFVYDRENEILMNYEAIASNTYKALCKRNIIMMSIKR